MNEFIKVLLSLSLSGTLLLMFIFLLKQFYKKRFSKCWQYYIWLLVVLRFLLPFTPDVTIVGSLFETLNTVITSNETVNTNGITAIGPEYTDMAEAPSIGNVNDVTSERSDDIYTYIFTGWFAVALILVFRKIAIYQKFIRYVKATNTAVSDIEILNLLADCAEKRKIKKQVELCGNPFITSPMMIGFVHPCIMIPQKQASKEELSYIFTHELIHYKRRDMFYKWCVQIVSCIHWFNPFAYLLGREINKACELSCDEAVIYSLDDKAKKAYGDVLISSLKSANGYRNSLASVTLSEGAEQIKERLGEIMDFKKKSKVISVATVLLTMTVCFGFCVTGAYVNSGAFSGSQNIIGTYERKEYEAETPGHFWIVRITFDEDMTYRMEVDVSESAWVGQAEAATDSGTYSWVDGAVQTVSYDWERFPQFSSNLSPKMFIIQFILEDDYLIVVDRLFYSADIPSRKTFEAECVMDSDGRYASITFHKDGTYEETTLGGANLRGTYERDGKLIHCTQEDGATIKDLYIYKDIISTIFYYKVNG